MQTSSVQRLSTFTRGAVNLYFRRNIGVTSYVAQKVASDPIQKLFVDKVKEYSKKSKSAGGKMFEASPQIEKSYKDELNRLEKQFGGGAGVDLAKFPAFNFKANNRPHKHGGEEVKHFPRFVIKSAELDKVVDKMPVFSVPDFALQNVPKK